METQARGGRMEVDWELIRHLEDAAGSEFVHRTANLIGAYRCAVNGTNHGEGRLRIVAEEAEQEMRKLLLKIRLRRAFIPETARQAFGARMPG